MICFPRIARCVIVLGVAAGICPMLPAQAQNQATVAPVPDPSVVTVDVTALHDKTGAVLPGLGKDDFRLLDNGHEMPIVSFGSGAHYSVAPIALWLVIECNNFEPLDFTSAFMKGKTQFLQPALASLDKTDAVGVAHWCGDGTQAIDLPPAQDAGAALSKLDELLARKSVEGANRQAEDAKQRMVDMILDDAKKSPTRRLPVIVFLYGDAGYAFEYEADGILRSVLSGPGIIYGLNDAGYHFDPSAMFGGGQIYFEIHYLSHVTGGDVYGTPDPKRFSKALNYILMQMHFRYTLGFRPEAFDGKKHDLKVELTPSGQAKYVSAVLRYRSQYIAAPLPAGGHTP